MVQDRQDKGTTTVNMNGFHAVGHMGLDYANLNPEDFPDGIALKVAPEGMNPHDFARAKARELNLQNHWEYTTLKAQTSIKAAQASQATGQAVEAGINAAIAWRGVEAAKINLQTADINVQIAESGLNIREIELEVVQYQENIALMTAPVKKGQFLLQGLKVQEDFYKSAAELVQARTDRDTNLAVLGIQGYNVEAIPLPDMGTLALPSFEFPSMDDILSTASATTIEVER